MENTKPQAAGQQSRGEWKDSGDFFCSFLLCMFFLLHFSLFAFGRFSVTCFSPAVPVLFPVSTLSLQPADQRMRAALLRCKYSVFLHRTLSHCVFRSHSSSVYLFCFSFLRHSSAPSAALIPCQRLACHSLPCSIISSFSLTFIFFSFSPLSLSVPSSPDNESLWGGPVWILISDGCYLYL